MSEKFYLPWRAVQRTWGYPDYEGGPEVRLWEVYDARDACVCGLTINCRSQEAAELIAAAINATAVVQHPIVDGRT